MYISRAFNMIKYLLIINTCGYMQRNNRYLSEAFMFNTFELTIQVIIVMMMMFLCSKILYFIVLISHHFNGLNYIFQEIHRFNTLMLNAPKIMPIFIGTFKLTVLPNLELDVYVKNGYLTRFQND